MPRHRCLPNARVLSVQPLGARALLDRHSCSRCASRLQPPEALAVEPIKAELATGIGSDVRDTRLRRNHEQRWHDIVA